MWQDISTAPKDGTWVILFVKSTIWNHGDNFVCSGRYCENPWNNEMVWINDTGADIEPTHWMPLPEAPEKNQ